jgi:hypothetical protein
MDRKQSYPEHVPKRPVGFFNSNMPQLFESERYLIDQMSPSVGQALEGTNGDCDNDGDQSD